MPNNVRTVVHRHQHYNKGGSGGVEVVGLIIKFALEVALLAIQFVLWAVPVIVQGLVWLGRNVVGPCLRASAEIVIRQASKISDTQARRGPRRPGGGR